MSLLARILEKKREEVRDIKSRASAYTDAYASFQTPPKRVRPPLDVTARLHRPSGSALRVIAEIKFKSPSAGQLSRVLGAAARAKAYADAGASMVSVLTDETFFDGSYSNLMSAAVALSKTDVPLLAKEFVIDPVQIAAAARSGADAVLLIVRIVDDAMLKELFGACKEHHIEPLVEVVSEAELERAVKHGARIVGVNARDLDTLEMDAARAESVTTKIPRDVIGLHLSGVKTKEDVLRIAGGPAHGALIGEVLMKEDDPRALLRKLVSASPVLN
jgi:indole-3-glycerol phosphate synthase